MNKFHYVNYIVILYGSCHSSICWAYRIFSAVFNTTADHEFHRNKLYCSFCRLHFLYWFHEQHGALQLRACAQVALLHISLPQVSYVYPLVSPPYHHSMLLVNLIFLFYNMIQTLVVLNKAHAFEDIQLKRTKTSLSLIQMSHIRGIKTLV